MFTKVLAIGFAVNLGFSSLALSNNDLEFVKFDTSRIVNSSNVGTRTHLESQSVNPAIPDQVVVKEEVPETACSMEIRKLQKRLDDDHSYDDIVVSGDRFVRLHFHGVGRAIAQPLGLVSPFDKNIEIQNIQDNAVDLASRGICTTPAEEAQLDEIYQAAEDLKKMYQDCDRDFFKNNVIMVGTVVVAITICYLTRQYLKASASAAALTQEKAGWEGEKKKLEGEKKGLVAEKANLEGQVQDKSQLETDKARLEGEVQTLTSEKGQVDAKLGQVIGERDRLAKAIEVQTEELAKRSTAVDKAEFDILKGKHDAQSKEVQHLRSEHDVQVRVMNDREAQVKQLQEKSRDAESKANLAHEEVMKQGRDLKSKYDQVLVERDHLADQLAQKLQQTPDVQKLIDEKSAQDAKLNMLDAISDKGWAKSVIRGKGKSVNENTLKKIGGEFPGFNSERFRDTIEKIPSEKCPHDICLTHPYSLQGLVEAMLDPALESKLKSKS